MILQLKPFTPDGYTCILEPRPTFKRKVSASRQCSANIGSGIAMIFRSCYGSRKMDIGFISNSFEHLALMLTNNGRRFICVKVYRPGSEAASNTFFSKNSARYLSSLLSIAVRFSFSAISTCTWTSRMINRLGLYRITGSTGYPAGYLVSGRYPVDLRFSSALLSVQHYFSMNYHYAHKTT